MENKVLLDIKEEIGEISESVKSAHKRIDELQNIAEAVNKMANNVGVMVNEMSHMKEDISGIKGKMDKYHEDEPNKLMFNAKNAVITGVIAALVAAIMGLILK